MSLELKKKKSNFQEDVAVIWGSEMLKNCEQQSWITCEGIFLHLFFQYR